jgi:hypothetical protein
MGSLDSGTRTTYRTFAFSTKKFSSLSHDIEISGWRSRYSCRLVVLHFAAPITIRFGRPPVAQPRQPIRLLETG